MGLVKRQKRNETKRASELEPVPGFGAGVKRWSRYLKRVTSNVEVKNPSKYLNASQRKAHV